MAGYNNNLTLHETGHTFTELEDRLKAVTWDWQIDGDETTSQSNLDKIRSAQAAYNAIRRDQGGLGKSEPVLLAIIFESLNSESVEISKRKL